MRRMKLSKGRSKRMFRKSGSRTQSLNFAHPMRGGIRL